MLNALRPMQVLRPLRFAGGRLISQPVFLTKADGTVFVTASGVPLVRGARLVTPQGS
jgi:hypothetical protein